MRIRHRSALSVIALLSLALSGQRPAPSWAQRDSGKTAAWVIVATADGAQAEFLVVLTEQADLSRASALPTRAEKGRCVHATLSARARATQRPLLRAPRAHDVRHRAFTVVNLIWVEGDAVQAASLAARPDVARTDGNPAIRNALPRPVRTPDGLGAARTAAIVPNDAYVRAPEIWAMGFTGQRIVIGGQDTGHDWTHLAQQPAYPGWDGVTADHDYNSHDATHGSGGVCGPDAPAPCDDAVTDDAVADDAVADDAVADDGGANQIWVAPGAQWIGCRNTNQGVGMPSS